MGESPFSPPPPVDCWADSFDYLSSSSSINVNKPDIVAPTSAIAHVGCDQQQQQQQQQRVPLCVGCGSPIRDHFVLRVSPNLEWHAGCLKCAECGQYLDETCTCYVRDGKTYCKQDYTRLFGAKCTRCARGFSRNDFVMRARGKIFHIQCFKCAACERQLIPGDEFALRDDELLCKDDHQLCAASTGGVYNGSSHHNNHHHIITPTGAGGGVMSPPSGAMHPSTPTESSSRKNEKRKNGKTTRVRTVLNEKQLNTLRACYAANCRPDALMKEQLTEMTGLSSRVIRVWFQNKRCKDKKRSIAMKQRQEQQQNGGAMQQQRGDDQGDLNGNGQNLSGLNGVAMVASEPIRNDHGHLGQPIDVQTFQQPAWKALSDFALQSELEKPPFQHLVSNFSDHGGPSSMSDSSDICSIPSVSSTSYDHVTSACTTPLTADSAATICS